MNIPFLRGHTKLYTQSLLKVRPVMDLIRNAQKLSTIKAPCKLMIYVQWNPSKTDTIGEITLNFVLYKEVSFIQEFLNYNLSHNI